MTTQTHPSSALCFACDYPLIQLQNPRCPECGRPFDPSNPHTYNTTGRPVLGIARRLLRIPAWPLPIAALIVFLTQLWLERIPVGPRLWNITPLLWSWTVIAASFLFLKLLIPLVAWQLPRDLRPARRQWLWLVPIIAALAVSAAFHDWGFYLAFNLSRPSLNRFIAEAQAAYPKTDWKPRSIGFFEVSDIVSDKRIVLLDINNDNYFLYAPDGIPGFVAHELMSKPSPLPAKDWYLIQISQPYPISLVHKAAANAMFRDLLITPDPRAYTVDFLIASMADPLPQQIFGHRGSDAPNDSILSSSDPDTIRPDIQAMTRLGPKAVGPLALALATGKSPPMNYLGALGLMGPISAPAAGDIAPLLKDPTPRIRQAAAWALGRIGPAARPQSSALWAALDDTDPWVQQDVRLALIAIQPDIAPIAPDIAARWQRTVTRFDIPVAGSRYTQSEEAAYDIRQMLVEQLLHAGPAAAGAAPLIAATMRDSSIYLRDHPYIRTNDPRETQQDRDYDSARSRHYQSITEGAHILAAIGPAARDHAPILTTLLIDSLKRNMTIDTQSHIPNDITPEREILDALTHIAPRDPQIIDLLLDLLAQSRQQALLSLDNTDQIDNQIQRIPMFLYRFDLARMIQSYDPDNKTIREVLHQDLRAPVNSRQRLWAVDLCRHISPPPDELFDALKEMIEQGNEDSAESAAACPPSLGQRGKALIPSLVTRINGPVEPKYRLIELLSPLDSDSPAIAECFADLWTRKRMSVDYAGEHLKAAAPLFIKAILVRNPNLISGLREKLRQNPPQDPNDPFTTLLLLGHLGPNAAEAIPDILPLLWSNTHFSNPREFAIIALSKIGWNPEVEAAIRRLLTSDDFQARADVAQWSAEFGPPILPLLLQVIPNMPDDSARHSAVYRAFILAAKTPAPLNQLETLLVFSNGTGLAPAILNSTGATASKIDYFVSSLNDDRNYPPSNHLDAARALLTLNARTPAAHDALFFRAWASPSPAVREACFTAINTLFPQ